MVLTWKKIQYIFNILQRRYFLKTNILKVLALILISSMLVVPVNASESDFSIMENNPQIVIKSDYAEEGTRVSVKVLESDYVKEETVFMEQSNQMNL